jgi:hypothetical protein
MAQLIQPFNANNFDPTQGVGGLPIGKHPVIIQSSEVKATKANDGGFLQLDVLILDGPQKGSVGAWRINLYNASQQAVDIANRQMSALSHVTGVFIVQDTVQLHNIPFVIEVGPQKNDPQYTEVKKIYDINGNEPGKAPAGGGAAQPQGQGGFGAPAGQQQQQQQPQQQPPAGGGWQPPAGGQQQDQNPPQQQQQQQPPANGGGQWAGAPAGGGFQPPAGQPPANGGNAGGAPAGGGWQQGAAPQNQGAAPQGGGGWQPPAGGNAGGPWGGQR